jgi:protein transport protein SEC61 subunit gamma and related proteins
MEPETKPSMKSRVAQYFRECARVLRITKKPTSLEFKTIVKVSGLGIAVIGIVGFLIVLLKEAISRGLQ